MLFKDVRIGMVVKITDRSRRARRENLVGLRAKVYRIESSMNQEGKQLIHLVTLGAGLKYDGSNYQSDVQNSHLTLWVEALDPDIETNEDALCLMKKV